MCYLAKLETFLSAIFFRNTILETEQDLQVLPKCSAPQTSSTSARKQPKNHHNQTVANSRCLDACRGLCTLLVVLCSATEDLRLGNDYVFFTGLGDELGILGLIVLNSFIATYDFTADLIKAFKITKNVDSQLRAFSKLCLIFMVNKFICLYIPFVLGSQSLDAVLLKGAQQQQHLWMIPLEIKYYFLLPFICLLFVKLKAFFRSLGALSIIFIELNERFRFMGQKMDFEMENGPTFRPHISSFFSGSLAAIVYCIYVQPRHFERCSKYSLLRIVISGLMFFFSFNIFANTSHLYRHQSFLLDHVFNHFKLKRYRIFYHYNGDIYFAYLIFAMATFDPNHFNSLLGRNGLLRSFGKYSFGIWLCHKEAIRLLSDSRIYIKTDFEILILATLFSFIYGWLYYYLIENPLKNFSTYLFLKIEKI